MGTCDMEKTSEEMNDFLKQNSNSASEGGMPLESIYDFSTLPISFEESSAVMLARAEDLFAMTTQLPRHSGKYLET